nr:sigma factor G inhibitor Gin [Salipaludibacillus sp. CUR1]
MNKELPLLKDCLICSKAKKEGIYVLGTFICEECEAQMVRTDTGDHRYAIYVDRLKMLKPDLQGGEERPVQK